MQTGRWDPVSGDERTGDESIAIVVKVVDNPVYDLRWNHRRHRRLAVGWECLAERRSRDFPNDRCRPPAALGLTAMKTSPRKLVWLGVLVLSTAAAAVGMDGPQVVIGGTEDGQLHGKWLPAFDTVEDIVDRWVENGREFINRNGQTCTCSGYSIWY